MQFCHAKAEVWQIFLIKCTNLRFILFEKYLSSFCRRLLSSIHRYLCQYLSEKKKIRQLFEVFSLILVPNLPPFQSTGINLWALPRTPLLTCDPPPCDSLTCDPVPFYRLGSAHTALIRPQAWDHLRQEDKSPLTPLPSVPYHHPWQVKVWRQ